MANDTAPREERRTPALAAASAHHLAEAVQAGRHGAADALDNQPSSHATVPSQTELTLLARVRDLHASLREETAAALNAIQADITSRRQAFTQGRFESRINGLEGAMRGLVNTHGAELEQHVYEALRAKREYAYFNYVNKRTADPKLDKWQFLLFALVVPLVVESLLNGNFFAEASDFGLVGGTATAIIISALNVSLGFIMGLGPARYCQHVRASHLFWALPAYVGMIALIVLFNLAVGHYRELLIASPDAQSLNVLPRMMANPLGIGELKSLALVIIGCIVALIAAMKGYSAFGSYPGQAAAYKRWRQRWDALETERRKLDSDLLPQLEAMRAAIDGFRDDCGAEAARLPACRAAAEQARDRYLNRTAQLRDAKDAAMMQYREANLKVRTELPPAYFSQMLNVAEVDQPREPVEFAGTLRLIDDFERQLANMPALVEEKLKDRLVLVRGLDLSAAIDDTKRRAAQAGREAFEQDEAMRKQAESEFAAMVRRDSV